MRGALNVGVDPEVVPKSEGELKPEVVVPPKMDGEVLEPKAVLLEVPKSEGVEVVEPNGFDEPNVEPKGEDVELKPVELKLGVLGANRFEVEVVGKGFEAGC